VSLLENPLLEKVEQNGVNGGKAPVDNKTSSVLVQPGGKPHFGSCFAKRFLHLFSFLLRLKTPILGRFHETRALCQRKVTVPCASSMRKGVFLKVEWIKINYLKRVSI